jgi:hypothetical protein
MTDSLPIVSIVSRFGVSRFASDFSRRGGRSSLAVDLRRKQTSLSFLAIFISGIVL